MSDNNPMLHYYFERYECLDGEGEYDMLSVSQSDLSFEKKQDAWLRNFIEFSASTNGQEPWSEQQIQEWFDSDNDSLEVYGGIRIYRDFWLREITRDEYDILSRFIP